MLSSDTSSPAAATIGSSRIAVLVPCYNEEAAIAKVVADFRAALPDAAIHAPWTARPLDLAAAKLELGRDYPRPVVDHDEARQRTLERFAVARAAR